LFERGVIGTEIYTPLPLHWTSLDFNHSKQV